MQWQITGFVTESFQSASQRALRMWSPYHRKPHNHSSRGRWKMKWHSFNLRRSQHHRNAEALRQR
ncbi:MAG: hypothetical protein WCH43_16680, partial [Verrucomicrobiota bacterium]